LELGKFIKEKRTDLGLTVRSLAEKAGVNNGYISLIENGKTKKPSPDILRKLSNSLELDYFSLMMLAGYYDMAFDQGFTEFDNERIDLFQLMFEAGRGKELCYHGEPLDESKKTFFINMTYMLLDNQLSAEDMSGISGMVEGYINRK
jgi:transcriptional regulator with XRE-family HTH domain